MGCGDPWTAKRMTDHTLRTFISRMHNAQLGKVLLCRSFQGCWYEALQGIISVSDSRSIPATPWMVSRTGKAWISHIGTGIALTVFSDYFASPLPCTYRTQSRGKFHLRVVCARSASVHTDSDWGVLVFLDGPTGCPLDIAHPGGCSIRSGKWTGVYIYHKLLGS
jgi:hypothetical protein